METEKLCDDYMELTTKRGDLKFKHIVKCKSTAKYKVKYRSGLRGEDKEQKLCQRHFAALKKRCEGVEKRTGWKSNLEFDIV